MPQEGDVEIQEGDIRVDVYRNGLARSDSPDTFPVVRITHIPTGIVTEAKERTQLQGKVEAMAELQSKLNARDRGA